MGRSHVELLEGRKLFAAGGGTDGGGMYFITQGDQITVQGTDSSESITVTDLGIDRKTGKNKVAVSRNGRVITTFYNFHSFIVNGYGGDDTLTVVSAKSTLLNQVTLNGGLGNDAIVATAFNGGSIDASGGSGNDVITGTANADVINGGSGNNVLNGAAGSDLFIKKSAAAQGGVGNDAFNGGSGVDTIKAVALTGEVTPNFGTNTFNSIEDVTFEEQASADPAETGQPPIW